MRQVSKIPDCYDPVPVELDIPENRGKINVPHSVRAALEGQNYQESKDLNNNDFKPTKMSATQLTNVI